MRLVLTFLLTVFVTPLAMASGPFGVSMGADPLSLKGAQHINSVHSIYKFEPSQPHSSFKEYWVQASKTHGVCEIKANTDKIQTNSFGTWLVAEFGRIEQGLKKVYGENVSYNMRYPGSRFSEPQDMMAALMAQEHALVAMWGDKSYVLKDNIISVGLMGEALGTDHGMLVIQYTFKNHQACIEEINSANDAVL